MMRPARRSRSHGERPLSGEHVAGKRGHRPGSASLGQAGAGGVPMPNIPQMASVWTDLGDAWVKSTKGAGATKARAAFTARRNIRNKIG